MFEFQGVCTYTIAIFTHFVSKLYKNKNIQGSFNFKAMADAADKLL